MRDLVGFITGMQGWFNTQNQCIKNHMTISIDTEKGSDKVQQSS